MFKYELEQTIFYLKDNRIHSAPVLSRTIVENLHEDWDSTEEQRKAFKPFGETGIFYNTCHGIIKETDAFASKEDLKESM